MKMKIIYLSAALGFSTLMGSYSSGPTSQRGDRTGSPISNTTCTECHGGGNFQPALNIQVKNATTQALVTNGKYVPGEDYIVTYTASSATGSPQFGLQSTILKSGNTQAGTFATPTTGATGAGTGAKLTTSSSVQYLEHNSRSMDGVFNINWTAPAAGTGDATIYAAMVAVNATGSTAGDNVLATSMTMAEDTSSVTTSIANVPNQLDYQVYPNPTLSGQVTLQGVEGTAQVIITDLTGRQVWQQQINSNQLELTALPQGMYQLTVIQDKKQGTQLLSIQ